MLACAHAWMLSREEACACVKDYASPSHLLGETRSRIVRPGKHPTRSLAHSPTRVRHGTVCGSLGILLGRWHATPALSKHGALGVSDDTPLARMWRELRMLRLADGPDEVHKTVIARRELKRFAG